MRSTAICPGLWSLPGPPGPVGSAPDQSAADSTPKAARTCRVGWVLVTQPAESRTDTSCQEIGERQVVHDRIRQAANGH